MADAEPGVTTPDDGQPTRQHWKWTVLASMASYIDAGTIVAGASGLVLWQTFFGMSELTVGLLTALGANAISCAIGALIGGRLGDLLGRKRIYAYDLLFYAFGALFIIFAQNVPMLFIGFIITGLAVGADVPTSLSLVGEFSPGRSRGKLIGLTQVAWSVGPVVVLLLALVLAPLEILGIRIVFAHLFVVALVTWYLRRGMVESARWTAASGAGRAARTGEASEQPVTAAVPSNPLALSRMRDLFSGPNLRALLFTGAIYLLWNIPAGSHGQFLPYILQTAGTQSQAGSVALQCLYFALVLVGVLVVFMRLADSRFRRPMFIVGAVMQVFAFAAFVFFPLTTATGLANVFLFGFGQALAGEAFYKLWSQEMFPTMLRGTAQGMTFATARVFLGVWSILVPLLLISESGLATMSLVLMVCLALFGVIGAAFMPNTAGKSLEEIETERGFAGTPAAAAETSAASKPSGRVDR